MINIFMANNLNYCISQIITSEMFPHNYDNINSDRFYIDKYLYLLSAKMGGMYRYYPDYIKEEKEELLINNKKRIFRTSCNNYTINNNLLLCFKYNANFNKGTTKKKNRHLKKKNEEFELRIIPNVKNSIKLIEDLHKIINHQGYLKLKAKTSTLFINSNNKIS